MEVLGDNKTSLTLIKDIESQNCTKHTDVMHHHVRGLVKAEKLGIEWIFRSSILANSLTKALLIRFFKKYLDKLGLVS